MLRSVVMIVVIIDIEHRATGDDDNVEAVAPPHILWLNEHPRFRRAFCNLDSFERTRGIVAVRGVLAVNTLSREIQPIRL